MRVKHLVSLRDEEEEDVPTTSGHNPKPQEGVGVLMGEIREHYGRFEVGLNASGWVRVIAALEVGAIPRVNICRATPKRGKVAV